MANETLVSFVNVTLSITPADGTAIGTQCILSIDGLGSKRSVSKKKCLNDKTLLSVGAKEYDTLNFTLPFGENSGSFHEAAGIAYDTNKPVLMEIEFDNKKTKGGNGTKVSGTAYITAYSPKNDDDAVVSEFSADWVGSPNTQKAK